MDLRNILLGNKKMVESEKKHSKHLILVDSSYAVFYRFHATRSYYAKSYPEEFVAYPDDYNWLADKVFMDNFNRQFKKNIAELPNKLGVNSAADAITFIWAIDCPGKDIWRHQYIAEYKGTRKNTHIKQKFHCYEIFKHVYEILLPQIFATCHPNQKHYLVKMDNCEADDIVAQSVLNYGDKYDRLYIIGSDTDYLQICDGVHIALYDILGTKKIVDLMGRKYLLGKIMCGDVSDNIPACKIFRCSMKSISIHLDKPDKMELIQSVLNKIAIRESQFPSTDIMPTPALNLADLTDFEAGFYKNAKVIDFTMLPTFYKNNIKIELAKYLS